MKKPIREVYNCDCVEYMRTLPDQFFELAIVDPPYGDALDGGNPNRFGSRFGKYIPQTAPPRSRVNHAWGGRFERYATHKDAHERREDAEVLPFLDSRTDDEETKAKYGTIDWDIAPPQEYFDELFRISKNQIIWGGNYFALPPTRCFIVWRKLSISENFSMAMAEYAWTSFNGNAKVYEAVPQRGKTSAKFHPTEKSIDLYMWTLKHFAHDGDKIFDSHIGSQNSRIAAYNLGLDYWGCEIDKTYFEKGCAHFEEICHGVQKLNDGRILQQLSLFD